MRLYVVVHHFLNMLAEPPLVSSYKSLVELGFLDTLHDLANQISEFLVRYELSPAF